MKNKILLLQFILAGCLLLLDSGIRAQTNTNVQAARSWATAPNWKPIPTNQFARFGSRFQHQSFQQTIIALRHAQLELQHSKDTFNGHQQSAIDACDKAIQELELVVRFSTTNLSSSTHSTSQLPSKPEP